VWCIVRRMVFGVFAVLAFIILRLTFRGRLGRILLAAIVIGLVADSALDLLVWLRE